MIKFSNNAATTLSSGISGSATSIAVVDASEFPTLGAGDELRITLSDAANTIWEIVTCTAIVGNTLTVVRGQESTAIQSWSSGENVSLRVTADALNQIQIDIEAIDGLPSQTGQNGKVLTTDGASASWDDVDAPVVNLSSFEYTATANQTAFSGSDLDGNTLTYTVGNTRVYVNGIQLSTSDYTASTGTTVVLNSGASVGDELVVVVFESFVVADHYTKSEVDSLVGSGGGSSSVPFYKADGTQDNIGLSSGELPFYKADGTQDNIGVI